MTDFVVTDYCSAPLKTVGEATAAIETYLETVVNTQTIIDVGIEKHGTMFVAWVLHRN